MERGGVGWVLAGLALAGATLLRILGIDDGHSTGYVVGAALGSVAGSLLVALLMRFLYVRFARRGRPLWSPWTLVIAAVISLVVAVGRAGEEAQERAEAERDCAAPARTAEQLAVRLPDGFRSAPADPAIVDQLSSGMADAEPRRITARSITSGSEPVGAVVVVEMREPADPDELFAGFTEGAGGQVEDAPLGSATGKLYRAPDGGATLVGLSERCAAAVVLGVSPRATRRIAAALPVQSS
jgi:hypothetical protein